MEKTLLELSFRAILIHLLNQIFYLNILHLKTIRERNDDETKKFSDTFYFSNFWFGLLFWKKEYPKFDMIVNDIIKNDYKKNCLKEIYFI